MFRLYINHKTSSEEWRNSLYDGSVFLMTKIDAAQDLCDFAQECIKEYIDEKNPQFAYLDWPIEEFIHKANALQSYFINCHIVKDLIKNFVIEIGEDTEEYYFDVPRIRVIPNYDYLHSGVSYIYKEHRDTWYGMPSCQINVWMPIFPIEPEEAMPLYPEYFSQRLENSSVEFDLKHWIEVERPLAIKMKTAENRKHPSASEAIDPRSKVLLAGSKGDTILFSGRHLHGSQPNQGNRIRYSTEFRLYNGSDLDNRRGPDRLDDRSSNKNYWARDLFRVSDFSRYEVKGKIV